MGGGDQVGARDTWFEVVGVSSKLQAGGVGWLCLPYYLPIPTLFPLFPLLTNPSLPSHPHSGLGTHCMCLCWVVVEGGEEYTLQHSCAIAFGQSLKFHSIQIAILNFFLCLPQAV